VCKLIKVLLSEAKLFVRDVVSGNVRLRPMRMFAGVLWKEHVTVAEHVHYRRARVSVAK